LLSCWVCFSLPPICCFLMCSLSLSLFETSGARGRRPLWSPPWVPVTFGQCEVL
jgi:hypothetical protein